MSQDDTISFPAPEDESQEAPSLDEMIVQVAPPLVRPPQPETKIVPLQDSSEKEGSKKENNDDNKDNDAFRTIGEVAEMLAVPVHVVRFWSARFSEIKSVKGQGGRRYYREEDIEFLRGLRRLLHEEGYTIKGVHRLIRKKGLEFVRGKGTKLTQNHDEPIDQILYRLLADLEQIKERLQKFAA